MSKEEKIEIENEGLYEQRVLVFMETAPQSNKYNQVLLPPEVFKQLTDLISRKPHTFPLERNANGRFAPQIEVREIQTSKKEYILPDLQSIN